MSASNELGYVIKRLQQALRNAMDRELAGAGLTTAQYAVLYNLQRNPGASNAELARLCFVTPQTMVRIVVDLERRGLLRRAPSATRGPALEAQITEAGSSALGHAQQAVDAVLATMLGGTGEEEAARLVAVLTGMATRLEHRRRDGLPQR